MSRAVFLVVLASMACLLAPAGARCEPPEGELPYKLLVAGWSGVFVVNRDQEIEWHYPQRLTYDAWQLSDREIVLSYRGGIKIVSPEKKTVWQYKPDANGKIEMHTVQPLSEGRFLGDVCGGEGDKMVFEIDRSSKRIVRSFAPETDSNHCHRQYRQVRKTPAGTYLVTFVREAAVREFSTDGNRVREFDLRKIDPSVKDPRAYHVLRLGNGNTLISLGYEGKILEVDTDDKVVWSLDRKEIADEVVMAYAAGMNVLPNGNLVVSTYDGRGSRKRNPDVDFDKNPVVFEVTRDKKVLWTLPPLGRMHEILHCQILSDDDEFSEKVIR
jgi:hypothetical protein